MAPSPPKTTKAEAAQLNNLSNFAGTELGWVPIAVRDQDILVSPLHSLLKIAQRSLPALRNRARQSGRAPKRVAGTARVSCALARNRHALHPFLGPEKPGLSD